ncbi:MAG TPA: YHYH protein [Bryobacteraceae bacterium]|nr:YHYH protein [Bryobacteraceae bacterium]
MKKTLTVLLALGLPVFAQPPGGPGGPGAGGDGLWRRNAYYGEFLTFDSCLGHQPNTGQYHYHVSPTCLRAELGDNLVVVRRGRTGTIYAEQTANLRHSPILGWALDGYPIYGPYGYSNPNDATSPVRRIASSYRLRNITERTSLPDWSLPNHAGVPQNLSASQYGPAVSTQYPLGRYLEDYEYVAGLGDLDQYNGRFAVTPEFPQGTYAYYTTIDSNGVPAFPYIFGGQFYGTAAGSFPASVTAATSDYFANGSYIGNSSTPELNSWATKYSKQNAAIVSGFDPSAGPVTTWPGANSLGVKTSGSVSTPTLAETQRIRYSGSSTYVTANGLAGYAMGPWFSADMTAGIFSNFPSGSNETFEFPNTPEPADDHESTAGGPQGMWVNGVAVFNFIDGASWSNASGKDIGGGNAPSTLAAISSSASFEQGPIAPGSLVTATPLFFTTLATSTETAATASWPTTLGGATVSVTDSAGTTAQAQISYASAAQINFRMPAGLATGAASVSIAAGGTTVPSKINIQPVYPNLFMINANALAAAGVVRVHNGQAADEQVYQVSNGAVIARPIPLDGDAVYLVLYGSGLGSAASATATIGGVNAAVAYAGPQGTYAGLDQYNLLIPASLAGQGSMDVIVTAGGKPSNPVNVTIQ